MDAIKAEHCQLIELLYAMNGFYGGVYKPANLIYNNNDNDGGGDFMMPSSHHQRIPCIPQSYTLRKYGDTTQTLPLICELLRISQLYTTIRANCVSLMLDTNEYRCLLGQLVNRMLTRTYITDLVALDYYDRLSNQTVCRFNTFLWYGQLFGDTLQVLHSLKPGDECLALFKLYTLYECKYELNLYNTTTGQCDPFFRSLWNWLTTGALPPPSMSLSNFGCDNGTSFFISITNDTYQLDFAKLPNTIEPQHAIVIYNIGNIMRFITSSSSTTTTTSSLSSLSHKSSVDHLGSIEKITKLYWYYYRQRHELYHSSTQFHSFVQHIKQLVCAHILSTTNVKDCFVHHLDLLRTFYCCYGNGECFWENFLRQFDRYKLTNFLHTDHDVRDVDLKVILRNALYDTFDETEADQHSCMLVMRWMQQRQQISSSSQQQKQQRVQQQQQRLKINFKGVSPMLKLILYDTTLGRYQLVFNYLFALHRARHQLVLLWKQPPPSSCHINFNLWHYLHHSLTRTLNILHSYAMFVIEYRLGGFVSSVTDTNSTTNTSGGINELDTLQRVHDSVLIDVITRLHIKNPLIANLHHTLFDLCYRLANIEQQPYNDNGDMNESNKSMMIDDNNESNENNNKNKNNTNQLNQIWNEYQQIVSLCKSSFQYNRKPGNFYELLLQM